jgi:hypothetical protein
LYRPSFPRLFGWHRVITRFRFVNLHGITIECRVGKEFGGPAEIDFFNVASLAEGSALHWNK